MAALRQSRRRGATLTEQAQDANLALPTHARADQFVTGLPLRADLATGDVHVVNAGHPSPYLLREGRVQELRFPPDLPFGMFADTTYHVHDLHLQPGDRLLLSPTG